MYIYNEKKKSVEYRLIVNVTDIFSISRDGQPHHPHWKSESSESQRRLHGLIVQVLNIWP